MGDATVTHFLCDSIQVQVHSLAVTRQRGKADEDYVAAAGCGHSTTGDAKMKNYLIPLAAAAYLAMSAVHAADPGVFIPGIVGGISMNTLVIARGCFDRSRSRQIGQARRLPGVAHQSWLLERVR